MEKRRARVAERLRAFAGLDPPAWLLDARLAERARSLGLDEEAYLELAAGESDQAAREEDALADLLRVGETRFFRHQAQIRALRDRVLPERARIATAEARPLAVWSAGCATGEEPYTLALLLLELAPPSGFEVLGTDLSEEALAVARRGLYAPDRLASIPTELRARGFVEGQIRPELAERVRFSRHNLQSGRAPGRFDLILCRNVLIYFDAEGRERVIARLWEALLPGGYLFVGYAETLRDHQARFTALRDDDGLLYRRREPDPPLAAPRAPIASPASPASITSPARPASIAPSASIEPPRLALAGDYSDGARLAAELRPLLAAPRAIVDLDGAGYLGDEAARVLERATRAAPGLELTGERPAIRRWLLRHGLDRGGGR